MECEKGIEKYTWSSLRPYLKEINPKLASVIDDLSPSDEYRLYLTRYPYGSLILDKGVFQVVNDEKSLVPLHHASIPKKINNDLDYNNTLPTGLVTHNSIETFFIAGNHTIPASLYKKGEMASLWRVLEGDNSYQVGSLWNVSSGARTICMLPKITDKSSYQSLKKKYNLRLPIPKSLPDHWRIFKDLTNHYSFKDKWYSEIIFFSKAWFKNTYDKAWAPFYNFMFNNVWESSIFRRNQFIFDFAFSLAQENRNLKPNPYLADTARHLIAIGSGSTPAMACGLDDSSAPIAELQRVFVEEYGLKKYAPVIMHLHHFSLQDERPVYYSLEMPTTTIFSPRSRRISSKMADMRELKHILDIFCCEVLKENLCVGKTPILSLVKNTTYHFLHTEKDHLNEISDIIDLPKIDNHINQTKNKFPEFSPFFKGCIAISKAK